MIPHHGGWLAACACCVLLGARAHAASAPQNPPADGAFLDEVQRAEFRFFLERADPLTGLVADRAALVGQDARTTASIAATGYGLAALPIGVERGWIDRSTALRRAEACLRFVLSMDHNHGWLYHFVDGRTGRREWSCEVSTIDTALLVHGALVCGAYFRGTPVEELANRLYDRLDWTWVLTNGGAKPGKLTVSMGWKPETGFIDHDWDDYCELALLVLLGLGARHAPLPPGSWEAWKRPVFRYAGIECLAGGPLFFHQMAYGYYDFRGRRDRLGFDYAVSAANATQIHRLFCRANASGRKTYAEGWWGLNACDGPDGYAAYGVPRPEDGTVAPLAVLASVVEDPDRALADLRAMRRKYGDRVWGRYGFCDAFNVDRNWFDADTIGIDAGMALLAIENHRSGLIWKLMASLPSTQRAFRAAGLVRTDEPAPRALRRSPPAPRSR